MYAALRLDLPAVPGPDQRDRNDLLIVLDMFQILERRVERGHIAFGVIADVAKPVVPVLPRLADEVVFIVLAEQTVGFRMLLRIIYDALDLNSHFKLFQLFSRRGFGLDRRPHRNIDHSLRDRFRNFGLPACEGVAGAGRGAVERGGRGILPKVRIDLIGENFFVLNAVGVGDGEGVGGRCYFALDFEDHACAVPLLVLFVPGHVEGQRCIGLVLERMLNLQALVIVRNIVGRSDRDFAGVKTLYSIILLIGDRISACNQAIGGISMIIRGDAVNGDQIAFLFAGIAGPIGLGVFLGLRAAGVVAFVRMVAAVNGAVAVCVMIVHALVADVAEAVFVLINTNVLPDRVEVGDLGGCCNRIAAFDRDSRIVRIPIPAEEFVAVSSWLLAGNGERHLAGVGLFSLRSRYTIFIAAVGVVVQGVGDGHIGLFIFAGITGYGDGEGRGFLEPGIHCGYIRISSTSFALA